MRSHTVPQKLLEHFAHYDPITKSKRLWRYQKGKPPYGRAAPISATAWDAYFADPRDAGNEAYLEDRLEQEIENPVHAFLTLISDRTFVFTQRMVRLLTRYVTTLFHRSRARRAASDGQERNMVGALRDLRADEELLSRLAAKQTMDLIPSGLRREVTIEELRLSLDQTIAAQMGGDPAQRRYIQTMETMLEFVDEGLCNGRWEVVRTEQDKPFVIGDAPVVTWIRVGHNALAFGQGFGRPNVEVLLPISPTTCLHILPRVPRDQLVLRPSVVEVNMAQAAFATAHCFANVRSTELDTLLQPHFGTFQIGTHGFLTTHINHKEKLFELLMNQPPCRGKLLDEVEAS